MTKVWMFLTVIALLTASCGINRQIPQIDAPSVAETPSIVKTEAIDVTVCDLKNDPAKYNKKPVKVSGNFARGFEVSALYDPSCKSDQVIWVELGGKRSVGVMYCCGVAPTRTREEELEVEGIKMPLTEDTVFKKYDDLLAKGKNVNATVVGTFLSGEKMQFSEKAPTYYGGYGHFGIGSLFIVQQVLSAEPTKIKNK